MRITDVLLTFVIAATGAAAACSSANPDFVCKVDADCVSASGVQGACEVTHRCSLPDTVCPTRRRYVEYAGTLSERCTDAVLGCVTDVRAGDQVTCVRKMDGSAWCWGAGVTTPKRFGMSTDIAEIAVGGMGVCVRHETAEVECATSPSAPVTRIAGLSAIRISVGANHACAVTSDRQVACWGANQRGQLGDGSFQTSSVPVMVGLNGMRQISAGANSTCALGDSSIVFCWGSNEQGELGRPSCQDCPPDERPAPIDYALPFADSVTVGSHFACATTSNGTVFCWGSNGQAQLIGATGDYSEIPIQLTSLTGVTRLTAGASHACVSDASGAVLCWGDNRFRQSTSATADLLKTPGPVVGADGLALRFVDISAGTQHTCGRSSDGIVQCWGDNARGEIGDGTLSAATQPSAAMLTCP